MEGGITPGLAQHALAQSVLVLRQIAHFFEHAGAGNIQHAADDDPPGFPTGVGVDGGNHTGDTHGAAVTMAAQAPAV